MSSQISLHLNNPSFSLEKQEFSDSFTLHFKQESATHTNEVQIQFSPVVFETLLNQGKALVPSPQTTLSRAAENATWREAAWPLYRLVDKEWQLLLRDVSSDSLVHTLWFMKDLQLARKVMGNFSERAAALLTEDLIARFEGQNPDAASQGYTDTARDSLRETLGVLERLRAQGVIAPST